MQSFCQDASTKAKPGEFWRKISPLLPKTRCNKNKGYVLIENEKVITDPKEIGETSITTSKWRTTVVKIIWTLRTLMTIRVYRELPTTNQLKGCSCCTALLKMTEDRRSDLDENVCVKKCVIAAV